MFGIILTAGALGGAAALGWRKLVKPMVRVLELGDELTEIEGTSAAAETKPTNGAPPEMLVSLANLMAVTGESTAPALEPAPGAVADLAPLIRQDG